MSKEQMGYVYVLKNPEMPGLIKIGRTDQDDFRKRLKTLNNTSVPVAFEAVHVSKVRDSKEIEHALHVAFEAERVNPRREFFRVDPHRVLALLRILEVEDATDMFNKELDNELAPEEFEARAQANAEREMEAQALRTKRPVLNFADLGIKENEHLYWRDDRNIFVTVTTDRKVIYDGKVCSLTRVTQQLLGIPYSVQPTPYWIYEGETLLDIYNRKFPIVEEDF